MPESLTSETSLRQTDVLPEFRSKLPPKVMWKMRIEGLHDHDYTPSFWLQDLRRRPNNRPCRFLTRHLFSSPETPDDVSSSSGESSSSSGTSGELSGVSDAAGELSDSLCSYRTVETNTSLDGHDSKSPQVITESLCTSTVHYTSSGTLEVAQPVTTPSPMSFLDFPMVSYDKPVVGPLTNATLATEFPGSSASSKFAMKKRPCDVNMPCPTAAFRSEKPWACPKRTTALGSLSHLAPHWDGLQTSSASERNTRVNLSEGSAASCQDDTRLPAGTAIHTSNPAYERPTPDSTVESIPWPSGSCGAKCNASEWQRHKVTRSRKRVSTPVDSVEKSTGSLGHDTPATKKRRIQDWLEEADIWHTRQDDA